MAKRPDKITDFKNDVYFKYLLADDQDPQCVYMLKLLIEGITHIKCDSVKVLNPNINLQNVKDKDMILDVRVKTDIGENFDIEMQNGKFSTANYNRFQSYGANNIVIQTQAGDKNYSRIRQTFQLIFINDIDKDNLRLIDTYKSRNEEGKVEKNNLITRSYIQIPMIDVIVREKGIENLTPLELAIYIFKNGIDNDIMKVKEQEVVKIMKEKMDKFNEDEELRLAAYNRQLNIMAHEQEKEEARQEGRMDKIIDFIQTRYGVVEEHWLRSLNEKQLESINNIIFKEETYEIFKQKVEAV